MKPQEHNYIPDHQFTARIEISIFNNSDPTKEPVKRIVGVDYNAGKNFPDKNTLVKKVLRKAIANPKKITPE